MRGAARFLSGGIALAAFVMSACATIAASACAGSAGTGAAGSGAAAGSSSAAASFDCGAAPGEAVTVFLEGRADDAPRRQTFEKVTFWDAASGTVPRYDVIGRDGTVHRLAYLDPAGALPVAAGKTYDLTVETVMGEPAPGAIVVMDEAGLLLAAASDTGPGRSVMTDGPPGFTVRLLDGGCRSRPVTKCYASRVNAILEVTRGGDALQAEETVRLGHGQRARLGNYEVLCHAAEKVQYTSACADAGVLAVSWTIRRMTGSGKP